MSRIGKAPIAIPGGVEVSVKGRDVNVKGPKGNLSITLRPEVEVAGEGSTACVTLSTVSSEASLGDAACVACELSKGCFVFHALIFAHIAAHCNPYLYSLN